MPGDPACCDSLINDGNGDFFGNIVYVLSSQASATDLPSPSSSQSTAGGTLSSSTTKIAAPTDDRTQILGAAPSVSLGIPALALVAFLFWRERGKRLRYLTMERNIDPAWSQGRRRDAGSEELSASRIGQQSSWRSLQHELTVECQRHELPPISQPPELPLNERNELPGIS